MPQDPGGLTVLLGKSGVGKTALLNALQPVGLALKSTRKKYGPAACCELLLVHHCQECGKVSANRLAADDDPQLLYWLYETSLQISPS